MNEALATLSAPEAVITVVVGEDKEFKFDVVIDGVIFDSFTNFPAALNTAMSIFKQRVSRTIK